MKLARSGMNDKLTIEREIDVLTNISTSKQNAYYEGYLGLRIGDLNKTKENLETKQNMKDSNPLSLDNISNRGVSWNIAFMDNLLRKEPYVLNAVNYKSVKALTSGIDLNIRGYEEDKDSKNGTSNVSIEINDIIEMEYLKPMMRFAFLGIAHGGAGNLIVTDNGLDEKQLLKPLTTEEIKEGTKVHLRPLTRLYQIQPDYSNPDKYITKIGKEEGIYDSTELGKPKYYRVSISGDMFGKTSNGSYSFQARTQEHTTYIVHRSRLMIYNSSELSWIEQTLEQFFGISIIEKSIDSIKRYKQTLDELLKLLRRSNIPVLNIEKMQTVGRTGNVGLDRIDDALLSYEYAIETGDAVVMGELEKFTYTQADFKDLNDQLSARKKELANALGVNMAVAFNEKDDNEESSYYYDIQMIQELQIRPALTQLIPLLYKSKYGKDIPEYSFAFRSLETTTEKEKAEKLKIVTEIIVELFEKNMVTVGTARDMLISATDNISDMLYELNKEFEKQLGNDDKLFKDFQMEIANELQTAKLKEEVNSGNNKYNMAETKVKGRLEGGDNKLTKKNPIDIK